jgi:Protein of unknown function (DUF2637)
VIGRADRWIQRITIGCVALLALIAGTVSYLHMHLLVELNGQPGWVAALTPLSVDGMIVAASTTLLAESRSGGRGGLLPWALLAVGSVASLAANVAVAESALTGRVIATWPSFSLIAAYELLMRHVRRVAESAASGRRPIQAVGSASAATANAPEPAEMTARAPARRSTPALGLQLDAVITGGLPAAQTDVERIAERVADEVAGDDHQHDAQAHRVELSLRRQVLDSQDTGHRGASQ